ncbi:hypothetical protein QOT17_022048, partial [Balamuthia mandrillaris]
MSTLRFLVLDFCAPPGELEEALALKQRVVRGLHEFASLVAATQKEHLPLLVFSLVVATPRAVEVLIKPQQFSLFTCYSALQKLSALKLDEGVDETNGNDNGILALDVLAKLIENMRTNSQTFNQFQLKVTFMSPRCIPCSSVNEELSKTLQFLYEANSTVEFLYLATEERSIEANTSLAEVALFLRDWINCTIQRIKTDRFSLQKLFRGWLIARPIPLVLRFPAHDDDENLLDLRTDLHEVRSDEQLLCDAHETIMPELMVVSSQNVCGCCYTKTTS